MPRPAKGSPEALAWAQKMREARAAKGKGIEKLPADALKKITKYQTVDEMSAFATAHPPVRDAIMSATSMSSPSASRTASPARSPPNQKRIMEQARREMTKKARGGKIKMPKMSKTTKKLVGAITDVAKKVGTKAGKPFEATAGVNPFTMGYDLGYNVIGPAVVGKGVPPPSRLPDVSPEAELMAGAGMRTGCCHACGGALVYI